MSFWPRMCLLDFKIRCEQQLNVLHNARYRLINHRHKQPLVSLFRLMYIQSTLVISNSKGHSEILRDNRTSTYQICRIEKKLIRLTTFNKYMCNWTLEVRDIY